jgi:hypothetical protein
MKFASVDNIGITGSHLSHNCHSAFNILNCRTVTDIPSSYFVVHVPPLRLLVFEYPLSTYGLDF